MHGLKLCCKFQIRVWALVAGYSFAFGSMFSKTWRIHMLFTEKNSGIKKVRKLMMICPIIK